MMSNADIQIVGDKVILVPYKEKHVQKYHEWMQDPLLREATASEPLSIDEEYAMQKSWMEDEDKCTFIILDQSCDPDTSEESRMVGDVNLFFNDPEDDLAAEIEVMVAEKRCRRKGLGLEAVLLMMAYAHSRLRTHKFTAKIGYNNHASLMLFRDRLGFQTIGNSDIFQETTLEGNMVCRRLSTQIEEITRKLCLKRYPGP